MRVVLGLMVAGFLSGCQLFQRPSRQSVYAQVADESIPSKKAPSDPLGLNAAYNRIMSDSGSTEQELMGKWMNTVLYVVEWSADSSLELFLDVTETFGGDMSKYEYLPNGRYKAGLIQVTSTYSLMENGRVLQNFNVLDKQEKYRIRIDADTMEWITYDESVYNNMIYARLERRDSI